MHTSTTVPNAGVPSLPEEEQHPRSTKELFKIHRFLRRLVWVQELEAGQREMARIAGGDLNQGTDSAPQLAAIESRMDQLREKLWPLPEDEG